ncbi:MAG: hypothetical protein ACI841_000136 [Planctomycetota bacterium]|jgi:hypothetical protein
MYSTAHSPVAPQVPALVRFRFTIRAPSLSPSETTLAGRTAPVLERSYAPQYGPQCLILGGGATLGELNAP